MIEIIIFGVFVTILLLFSQIGKKYPYMLLVFTIGFLGYLWGFEEGVTGPKLLLTIIIVHGIYKQFASYSPKDKIAD